MNHGYVHGMGHVRLFTSVFQRFRIRFLAASALFIAAFFIYFDKFVPSIIEHKYLPSVHTNFARFKNGEQSQFDINDKSATLSHQSIKQAPPVACFSPILSLNTSHINHFFKPSKPFQCEPLDWVIVESGEIRLHFENIEKLNIAAVNVECHYLPFVRRNDYKNKYLKKQAVAFNSRVKMVTDFARIDCEDYESGLKYSNVHASVVKKAKFGRKLFAKKVLDAWNVLYIGFDSTSRLTFERQLPLSFQYLTKNLGAIILKRYNIVGDGTPQALIPLLTGHTEQELPDVRMNSINSSFGDIYPNIWRKFWESGYTTLYAEDYELEGMFAGRLRGFKNQPTDHFFQNFHTEAHKRHKRSGNPLIDSYCIGGRKEIEIMLEYTEQFFEAYPITPKFDLTYSAIGHDSNNRLDIIDQPLYNHLKYMKDSGKLDRTILIVFGDHGARYSHIRQTQDGKMEERNPMFSFVLPEEFKRKHPQAAANLKKNEERLCTPFDVYETVLSLITGIDTKPVTKQMRGISLFREIPLSRTCADAHIEPHWCACLNWVDVTPEDSIIVEQIIQDYIDEFNKITEQHRELCTPLELNNTRFANKLMPDEGLMNYEWVKDLEGYVPRNKKGYSKLSSVVYTVTFDAKPGRNVYECTATYDVISKKIKLDMLTVSVLNYYSKNGHCVRDINYNAERYCFCNT